MTRSTPPPLLAELQNSPSESSQADTLKLIKNEIIGHDLRKRSWIAFGIVPTLVNILSNLRQSAGKRNGKETNGLGRSRQHRSFTLDDDAACTQAAVIAGVLAQGGLMFVQPILHGNLLPPLLTLLTSDLSSPTLRIAVLKTLITIADRLPPATPSEWLQDQQLAALLYSREHIGSLASIIGQSSPAANVQQSIHLAATLIVKTCSTNKQKKALAEAGLLDVLATKLSSFVVSQGFVLPGAEARLHESGSLGILPPSAPPRARLAPLLQLAAVLVHDSRALAEKLLSSPAMVTVFPIPQPEFSPSDVKKSPWSSATYLSGTAVPRHLPSNPIDSLLPDVPMPSAKLAAEQASFPPLSSATSISKKGGSFLSASLALGNTDSDDDALSEEDENPAIAWLIYLVRSETGTTRLMAAKLLISLYRQGLARKARATMFCMLLVPLLVRMLDKDYDVDEMTPDAESDIIPTRLLIKEEAPGLLAMLVVDSRSLQKAAVDSDAIKKLSRLLKESFDPIPAPRRAPWYPEKTVRLSRGRSDKALGETGPSPLARHVMRHREAVLKALASLAPFEEQYRKSMCDLGIVPYIIDSLKPYTSNPLLTDHTPVGPNFITGNPAPILLAACAAARALTRSVSVLRTSLIDAGVAPPLFHLLNNPDSEVQIAATKVVCNLALDFSPMKDAIVSHNIIGTLCQHAHSANPMLRLDSLWALKHLVYNSSNDLKFKIFQELKPAWIKHLMATDPEDITPGTVVGMGITHGFGEDVVPRLEDGSVDTVMAESPGLQTWNRHTAERRAQAVSDDDYSKHTVKDDIMIQTQVLELVVNLICGDGADEVVEYIFKEFNQRELFAILARRLKPRLISHSSTAQSNKRDISKATSPTTEIIKSVLAIIIHIAAATPRYRTVIISQTEIMKLILGTFGHVNREVRRHAIWIIINLMYHDDSQDKLECRRRAKELEKLGFVEKVMGLKDDMDVDVKERTKTALSLFADLLHG
jgi:armadillo repeat-containing protein 8